MRNKGLPNARGIRRIRSNLGSTGDALGLNDNLSIIIRPLLAKPSHAEWVEFVAYVAACAADRSCDLIVFDTFSAFVPWKNENDSAEVQATMLPLNRMTQEGRTVGLFHHFGKADTGEGRAARGSTALVGSVDIVLEMRATNQKTRPTAAVF